MVYVTSQRLALEIVRFGESSPLTVLKRVERGRYPDLYIVPFVLLPSRCGTLQSIVTSPIFPLIFHISFFTYANYVRKSD